MNPAREIAALREQLDEAEETIRQLRLVLRPPVVTPLEWRLTRAEVAVFGVLLNREVATAAMMITATRTAPASCENGDPAPKIAHVWVCRLRQKLARFGVRIDVVWGVGFTLADRAAWRKRLLEAAP
jgi:two-component system cell cycle response regulator CtrA